jgi:hypothetical protein
LGQKLTLGERLFAAPKGSHDFAGALDEERRWQLTANFLMSGCLAGNARPNLVETATHDCLIS